MTEYIILGFLMTKSMTGYDIKQNMAISTSNFFDASFGSIYPALKRLLQKQLIEVEEIVEGGKLKKLYSLTNKGKEEFISWLKTPIEPSKTNVTSALCKIFFFDNLSKKEIISLINKYISDLSEFKGNLLRVKEKVLNHGRNFEMLTLDFGLDYYDFIIKWYRNYINSIDNKEL